MASVESVYQLVGKIQELLEGKFTFVGVEGEISNLTKAPSGHWYFSLSDSRATIGVALFRSDAERNPLIKKASSGDKIICYGRIGVYSKRGTFQIIAHKIVLAGAGTLMAQLEERKKKLASEGIFSPEHKRLIPPLPRRVGLITSDSAAALQDFLNIYRRRGYWMDIVLARALVQGESAPASLRQALGSLIAYNSKASSGKKLEVIVLTRGGGSLEDLWAFNDEALARDIFNCPIPLISAVGHQRDFSISDMVADLRAETPSAAAEILTEKQQALKKRMEGVVKDLTHYGRAIFLKGKNRLMGGTPRLYLSTLQKHVSGQRAKLNQLGLANRITDLLRFHEKKFQLDDLYNRLRRTPETFFLPRHHALEKGEKILMALGPDKVLSRGYCYVSSDKNKVIPRLQEFKKLNKGTTIKLTFHDGKGDAHVAN